MRRKRSRPVLRGAVGKVPFEVTRRPSTLHHAGGSGAAVGRATGPLTAAQPTGLSWRLAELIMPAAEVSTERVTA